MLSGRAARECRPYLSSAQVLHSSHHSSLVWIVIRSVELGCCAEIAQGRFGVGHAHQRFTYEEAAESKRLKMTQRFRTFSPLSLIMIRSRGASAIKRSLVSSET